jgi:integrase
MAIKVKELSAVEVARLVKPGMYCVGYVNGLSLQVLPARVKDGEPPKVTRAWILRVVVGGVRRKMGLGAYPGVSLARARELAQEKRAAVEKGGDPIAERRAVRAKVAAEKASAITFDECAEKYIAAHRAGWRSAKHADQWTNTLATYASPYIGKLLVREITVAHVMQVLEQRETPKGKTLWESKTETATRVRSRIELVLSWAIARRFRDGPNPAVWKGTISPLLPKRSKVAKVVHHPALPVGDVGAFMDELRKRDGIGARALEWAILNASRSSEARLATWKEIDENAATWTISAERMKAERPHRVPLSSAALAVLKGLAHRGPDDFIFPAPRANNKPLSDGTLNKVLRDMNVPAVAHGVARSTFRDWCSERTDYPGEVCEMALAHTISNAVEAAYRRGDLFEKRRALMQDWAVFCSKADVPNANVHQLHAA